MVRLSVTQVVWKNSEDEILKAAVMKYGLNQWGRVASLFAKRSAKACKARWDEWLDPRIKKTEWSREEDEKLLHLAKLMPTQWRTIAPLVGRTASQCLERYERLLSEAAREEQEEGEGGEEESKRNRLKMQAPETLPAKPDAVDLEDEEMEMLNEARARLANTMGKKAKRKARERQLEAQQRQTLVQKRRELKAQGISGGAVVQPGKRRRKNSDPEQIDFTTEVPFELLPPPGLHDVREENLETLRRQRDEKQRLANLNRMAELKKQQQQQQQQRGKSKKTSAKELELKLELERQRNEEALRVARGARAAAFTLPQPQVSDAELEDVAKVSATTPFAPPSLLPLHRRNALARGEDGKSSSALVDDAESVAGNHLPSLASRRTFAGANGRVVVLRDELGINRTAAQDAMGDGHLLEDAEHLASFGADQLRETLRQLPQPEYEYTVQVKKRGKAQMGEEEEDMEGGKVEDARAAVFKRQRLVEERNMEAARQRPTAVKLGLPDVPPLKRSQTMAASGVVAATAATPTPDLLLLQAQQLIDEEMQRALAEGDSISVHVPEMEEIARIAMEQAAKLSIADLDQVFARPLPAAQFAAQARAKITQLAKQYDELTRDHVERILAERAECGALQQALLKACAQAKRQQHAQSRFAEMQHIEDDACAARLQEARELLTKVQSEEAELQDVYAQLQDL